jgi:hypothetical protein
VPPPLNIPPPPPMMPAPLLVMDEDIGSLAPPPPPLPVSLPVISEELDEAPPPPPPMTTNTNSPSTYRSRGLYMAARIQIWILLFVVKLLTR